jgi:opacity protein-like surface antigen
MKLDYRIVCMTLAMCGFSASAVAQDEPVGDPVEAEPVADDPTAGDMGGEVSTEGDAAPVEDAGDGGAEKPISVKLLLGYGLSLEGDEPGPDNPWGLGFGLGGGYNLDQIYLGVRFIYYLGSSESVGGMDFGINFWELGIEGGYDVDLGGAILRPGLGIGMANLALDLPAVGGIDLSASEMYLYVAPGVGVQFDVSDSIFLGAEARFKMVFAENTATGDSEMLKGLILMASGGMKF